MTLLREVQLSLSIVQTSCPCSMSTALFLQQTLMSLSMNDIFVMMVHSNHRILKDLFYTILDGKERRKCYFLIKRTEFSQLMQSISYSQDGASAYFQRMDFNMVKRSITLTCLFQIFSCFWKKYILCPPRLHLFDQKYSKNSNIVKYYLTSKYIYIYIF